jgi:hypothetical protein
MSKKYHLDQNNVAFIHCINGAFAGIYTMLELAKSEGKKRIPRKKLIEALQDVIAQTNTAITSEYIRGELIKKGVLENGDNTGLCTFDPSIDNENSEAEVYTQEELKELRIKANEPTWANSVKGR